MVSYGQLLSYSGCIWFLYGFIGDFDGFGMVLWGIYMVLVWFYGGFIWFGMVLWGIIVVDNRGS